MLKISKQKCCNTSVAETVNEVHLMNKLCAIKGDGSKVEGKRMPMAICFEAIFLTEIQQVRVQELRIGFTLPPVPELIINLI